MDNYQKLKKVRDESRLTGRQLCNILFDQFIEQKGDRLYGEDSAIYGGIAAIGSHPFTVICQDKGSDLDEKIANNFGMAHPEGYRKAIRLMQAAEKFNRPIITIVDTAGAYPGIESEERGQASAIANSIYELAGINVPVITLILSEGGSGGALALAHSDYIMMFENAYYSVISPEGYSEILYKSQKSVDEIIEDLPIFSDSLIELEIVDEVINEPTNGLTKENYDQIEVYDLQSRLVEVSQKLKKNSKQIVSNRHDRFRKFGK